MPFSHLAAAAAIVTATAGVAAVGVAAAVAQQEDQNDDPAHISTAKTIVTHISYLRKFLAAEPLIP